MPQNTEENLNISIHSSALPTLGRASQLFLSLGLHVQGVQCQPGYNQMIVELQRMRSFLQSLDNVAKFLHCKSPVEVLDLMAKKQLDNLVFVAQALLQCTTVAHLLQSLLVHCLQINQVRQAHKSEDIKVDPSKITFH